MNRIIHIKAIIFDWAGTMIDYGSLASISAFQETFKNNGISITVDEAKQSIELLNKDYIREIFKIERVSTLWYEKCGKTTTEFDIEKLYSDFKQILLNTLSLYAEPIPGAVELVKYMREKGVKIGSTTNYTKVMMDVVSAEAKKRGYSPDCIVTVDDVPAGRPYPWMCYMNALRLGIYPLETIVKVGDTISDVKEGLNAGMWSVAVIEGSSELGLSLSEIKQLNKKSLKLKLTETYDRFKSAGAHYVIKGIADLPKIIEDINGRLKKGEIPNGKRCRFS